MRGPHDVGGLPAGPVDRTPHDHSPLEKQVDAVLMTLVAKKIMCIDEMRRVIEALGHDGYNSLAYYDKWTAGLARALLDKAVIGQDEIDARIRVIRARMAATGRIEQD